MGHTRHYRAKLTIAGCLLASGFVVGSGIDVSGMSFAKSLDEASAAPVVLAAKPQLSRPASAAITNAVATVALANSSSPASEADAFLASRTGSADLAVYDLDTGSLWTTDSPETKYETASIIKVTILIALLEKAENENRGLTASEKTLAQRMISISDNGSTTALWKKLGEASGLRSILAKIGTTDTTPPDDKQWGLTTTTASDQVKIMRVIAESNDLLTDESRATAKSLLSTVIDSQHWGVSSGVASPTDVLLKNGWLASNGGWDINSVGIVNQDGHNYVIAALSNKQKSQATGIATVSELSNIAWNAS